MSLESLFDDPARTERVRTIRASVVGDTRLVPVRGAIAHAVRRHPLATCALLGALLALVFFGARLLDRSARVSRPPEPDLKTWMSPRYVARSWNLPRKEIFRIMEIDADAGREAMPRTLAEVIERTGLTLEELQRRVEIADEADRHRRERDE